MTPSSEQLRDKIVNSGRLFVPALVFLLSLQIVAPRSAYAGSAFPQDAVSEAIRRTEQILNDVRAKSFPELSRVDVRVRTFSSKADFFRTRFNVSRYLSFRKMQYYIEVNPRAFDAGVPEDAVKAILAHELEHVVYLSRQNRIKTVSLVQMASADYTARFERQADLGAVGKGYAAGLIEYRTWLFENIPQGSLSEKQRDYFSPAELLAIESVLKIKPYMLRRWMKNVPLNLDDINRSAQR